MSQQPDSQIRKAVHGQINKIADCDNFTVILTNQQGHCRIQIPKSAGKCVSQIHKPAGTA
jgi:hypothetical protein